MLALPIVEAEPARAVRVRSSPNQKKKLLDVVASVFDGGGTRPDGMADCAPAERLASMPFDGAMDRVELENKYDTPLVEAEYKLEAAAADPVVAQALQVPAGSPIFLIERTSYTTGNRPVDYERLHYRGDLIRFVTRLARGARPRCKGNEAGWRDASNVSGWRNGASQTHQPSQGSPFGSPRPRVVRINTARCQGFSGTGSRRARWRPVK